MPRTALELWLDVADDEAADDDSRELEAIGVLHLVPPPEPMRVRRGGNDDE